MSTNRFPTTCTKCRRRLDAGKGTHTGKQGRFHTYVCAGSCDGALPFDPTPTVAPATESHFERTVRELVLGCGDNVDLAWREYEEMNEFFDGEVAIRESSRIAFYKAAARYLSHPDIVESRIFAAREALEEYEVYERMLAEGRV